MSADAFPVLAGRQPGGAMELACECALIGVAAFQTDAHDGAVGLLKQFRSRIHPELDEQLPRGKAEKASEALIQLIRGKPRDCGQFGCDQPLTEVVPCVLNGGSHAALIVRLFVRPMQIV